MPRRESFSVRVIAITLPALAALAAGATTIAGRGGDPVLALRQQQFERLSRSAVESLVGTAPDPRGEARPRGRASCRPGRKDDLRNPWRCSIAYRGDFRTRYLVTISPRGSYFGKRLDDAGSITGCCVALGNIG